MQIGTILPADESADAPASWVRVRDFALTAEQGGLDSVWLFDHVFHESRTRRTGMLEAWTTLSALAVATHTVRLGTLVLCSPFRNPVLVAKMAATADEVSGGRLILGLGAGWHDPEFAALGIPTGHRVDRFAEALPIITALLRGETVTVDGEHHELRAAELLPAPTRRVPVLVAAFGPRMLRLTARYADAWNTAWYGAPDEELRVALADMRVALEAADRDPASMSTTVGLVLHDPGSSVPSEAGSPVISGSVDEVARILDEYRALGVDQVMVQPHPHTPRTLERLIAARALTG